MLHSTGLQCAQLKTEMQNIIRVSLTFNVNYLLIKT